MLNKHYYAFVNLTLTLLCFLLSYNEIRVQVNVVMEPSRGSLSQQNSSRVVVISNINLMLYEVDNIADAVTISGAGCQPLLSSAFHVVKSDVKVLIDLNQTRYWAFTANSAPDF